MTAQDQLAFDMGSAAPDSPIPMLKKNPARGPARLLRTIVAGGLDPAALDAAAMLVELLEHEPVGHRDDDDREAVAA